MFCINPLDLDVTLSNVRAKMMVFDTYVMSMRSKARSIDQFNTTFVVFKNSQEGCSCANNQPKKSENSVRRDLMGMMSWAA
jgi:hypothetical protein